MLPLLQGIRVLDFTTIVLGPYATQTLGDLGADVVKIEPLQGDLFRTVRPGRSRSMGAGFMGFNRNKRSLAIDLKHPESRPVLARLVAGADAVVHNMRPRAAEPLGLTYAQLTRIRPDLVYAFAAGYDQRGPNADEPAYDDIIQAASGVAALNANAAGEPRYLSTILCDKVGGLHLAVAVATGLAHRARTGKGCCLEAPMFESSVAFLLSEQLGGETFVPALGPTGYDRLAAPNRKPFRTADGFMAILPYNGAHWAAFFELIGRAEFAHSPQVQDPVLRSQGVDSLYAIIAEVAPTRTTTPGCNRCATRTFPVPGSTPSATCCTIRTCRPPDSSANTSTRPRAACAVHGLPSAGTMAPRSRIVPRPAPAPTVVRCWPKQASTTRRSSASCKRK
jgi:crotonobetainyl-CoA:carnitine CoA-transferase CaiB-like acyl-CoA transferase